MRKARAIMLILLLVAGQPFPSGAADKPVADARQALQEAFSQARKGNYPLAGQYLETAKKLYKDEYFLHVDNAPGPHQFHHLL